MKISIVGASGNCGRQLAIQLLDRELIPTEGLLQLVGHKGGKTQTSLWSLKNDLEDAFGEYVPNIDVLSDPEKLNGDIVIILAGRTFGSNASGNSDRSSLAETNKEIFKEYAIALSKRNLKPIIIIQSNPVELGVSIFSQFINRKKIFGAGAWSDTLRLRYELAKEIKSNRKKIDAWMLGQHGENLVPCLSGLNTYLDKEEKLKKLKIQLIKYLKEKNYIEEKKSIKSEILEMITEGKIFDAYLAIKSLNPILRASIKPFFTHFTSQGHSTEVATAHSVVDIIESIIDGRKQVFAAQVNLQGEWLGIKGVCGVPIIVGQDGWSEVVKINLNEQEEKALKDSALIISSINEKFKV
tara:strand:+ start:5308 stop:6369 length:1062 start_codon:yes stop_codon:yes gene_type:complete